MRLHATLLLILLLLLSTAATVAAPTRSAQAIETPVRFATFNASLNRFNEGDLVNDLSTPDNQQAQVIAEIIQRVDPDVVLINEFDYDDEGAAADLFRTNYLEIGQNGADPVTYPHVFVAESNTGIPSGFDLDNSGGVGGPGDAYGFGFFPGQFGMVLYSKFPIVADDLRTFQTFLWKDMPGALLPDDPGLPGPADWYSPEELDIFRLSSKSHWDVPIDIDGDIIHALVSHPTPPVFDGAEDRNGTRNHDEIRFWADYVTPGVGDYIYDDDGESGGLAPDARFVIMGDLNADPFDGDSTAQAIDQLIDNPYINTSVTPTSAGAVEQAALQSQINDTHQGNPAFDTADFADGAPGNLRADYVLPSINLDIVDAGVFWPTTDDSNFDLVGTFPFPSSDHRLVYVDLIDQPPSNPTRYVVDSVEFIGELTFPTGHTFGGTEFGGISGLAYDADRGLYYALSDDRSQINAARLYALAIDVGDGSLDGGDIDIMSVVTLTQGITTPMPFEPLALDPEGIALAHGSILYISSEGDADAEPPIDPFIRQFTTAGTPLAALLVPDHFFPAEDGETGIRNNLAFESLAVTPNEDYLYTAVEGALQQDGPAADVDTDSLARLLKYNLLTSMPAAEYIYPVAPVPEQPIPANAFRVNGLVELVALDNNGTMLALERAFSVGRGNTVKLFQAYTQGAVDVRNLDSLQPNGDRYDIHYPLAKKELVDFGDLVATVDNLEALAFGPDLADGRSLLIVASDNNFNAIQFTQFIALAVDLAALPTAQPAAETHALSTAQEQRDVVFGHAIDPAIWVNPLNSAASRVIGAANEGGVFVFNLDADIVQHLGEGTAYQQVDLLYTFVHDGNIIDLVIAAGNNSLALFEADSQLSNLVPLAMNTRVGPAGVEQPVSGLASYRDQRSGRYYILMAQGASISQRELISQPDGTVDIVNNRTIELPASSPDQAVGGIAIDHSQSVAYITQAGVGLYKLSLGDPTAQPLLVHAVDDDRLHADLGGVAVYQGGGGRGYVLVSDRKRSAYSLFSRDGGNPYINSFAIGDGPTIDQANRTAGLDVINVNLGDNFPSGLLVVQDAVDAPQQVVVQNGSVLNTNTNFKFVPWQSVADGFMPELIVDTDGYNPHELPPTDVTLGQLSSRLDQASPALLALTLLIAIAGATTLTFRNRRHR